MTTLRAPVEGDFDAVLALIHRCELADDGEAEATAEDEREVWTLPGLGPARDLWLVESDGAIVGYGHGWFREQYGRIEGQWYVDPAARDGDAGDLLMAAMEARGREVGAAVVKSVVSHANEWACRLLESCGFEAVRYYCQMRIDLDEEIPEAVWPEGVGVRTAVPGEDDREVHALVQEQFKDIEHQEESPFEEWHEIMMEGENFDPSTWFLTVADGEIVGVALCPAYEHEGWVRQVAVRRDWRRRGLATALLRTAFAEFRRRGKPHAGLVVDSYNTSGAMSVYESAGMRVHRQYDGYEKRIRE